MGKIRMNLVIGMVVWAIALMPLLCIGCGNTTSPKSTDDFLAQLKSETSANPSIAGEGVGTLPPAAVSAPGDVPEIALNGPSVDLGVVPNDNYYVTTVPVFNRGKAELIINDIQTTCACTVGKMKQANIKPGGQGDLEITITPYRIPGFTSHKILTLISNDPKNPKMTLDVLCKVNPEFEVTPENLEFGKVEKGQKAEGILRFRALQQVKTPGQPDAPVTVGGITALGEPKGLSAVSEKLPEDKWATPGMPEYQIQITLDTTESPLGPYAAQFQIVTSAPRIPRFLSNVRAEIVSFYKIEPQAVTIQSIKPGETVKDVATVSSETGPFELSEAKVSGPDLSVSVHPGPGPNSYAIDVTALPAAQDGHKQETITFTLKSGDKVLTDTARVFAIVQSAPKVTP